MAGTTPEYIRDGMELPELLAKVDSDIPCCSSCLSFETSWNLSVRARHTAPGHNLMGLHDVEPMLVLGCDECSDTLAVITDY